MIIVVEGPDNAGKTTLAMTIAKKLRALFIKAERPANGADLDIYCSIIHRAQAYSGNVVLDRHLVVSEPIYGLICRGGHDLPRGSMVAAWNAIDILIYCRPPTDFIMKTLSIRPQMEGVIQNAMAIISAYDDFFTSRSRENHGPGPKLVKFDYSVQSQEAAVDFVELELAKRARP